MNVDVQSPTPDVGEPAHAVLEQSIAVQLPAAYERTQQAALGLVGVPDAEHSRRVSGTNACATTSSQVHQDGVEPATATESGPEDQRLLGQAEAAQVPHAGQQDGDLTSNLQTSTGNEAADAGCSRGGDEPAAVGLAETAEGDPPQSVAEGADVASSHIKPAAVAAVHVADGSLPQQSVGAEDAAVLASGNAADSAPEQARSAADELTAVAVDAAYGAPQQEGLAAEPLPALADPAALNGAHLPHFGAEPAPQAAFQPRRGAREKKSTLPSDEVLKAEPPAKAARRAGTITILDLIEHGLIVPGPNALRSDYKNASDFADVLSDGRIRQNGHVFDSPSAFSVWSKRKLTPDRKSDDGWKSLKYREKPLEHYKNVYLERMAAIQATRVYAAYRNGVHLPGPSSSGDEPGPKRLCLPGPLPAFGAGPSRGLEVAKKPGGLPGLPGGLPPLFLSAPGEAKFPPPAPRASTLPPAVSSAKLPPAMGHVRPPAATAHAAPSEPAAGKGPGRPRSSKASAKGADPTYAPSAEGRQKGGEGRSKHGDVRSKGGEGRQKGGDGRSKGGEGRQKGGEGRQRGGEGRQRSTRSFDADAQPEVVPGEMVQNRTRRCIKQPRRFGAQRHADHNMVPLEQYKQLPGSLLPDAQPFKITVHPVALVAMDIHAHLCQHEIIGVLGGRYDPALGTIEIMQARSVKELSVDSNSDAHINVEMDPVDQQRVVQELHACDLQCVGWYHSHPTFPALPSGIDVLNQVTHQMHHGGVDGKPAPYIAAIVGPYHQKNNGLQSVVTWFYVERDEDSAPTSSKKGGNGEELLLTCMPKALTVETMKDATLTSMDIFQLVGPLVTTYSRYAARTDFAMPWREKTTHLQKMVASMYTWCQGHLAAEDMYEVGKKIIDFAWRTFYPQPGSQTAAQT